MIPSIGEDQAPSDREKFSSSWTALAAAALATYFLYFAGDSLQAGFTYDDLMNTYRAWDRSWKGLLVDNLFFFKPSPVMRPFPEAMCKLSFSWFGFNLEPFRALLLAVLMANAALLYLFCSRVSGSKAAGLIAAALIAYHPGFAQMYYNTGSCFDVFCFFFYFAALLQFDRIHDGGGSVTSKCVFLILFICALDSKEMAVSLPLVILFLERGRGKWAWITGIMALAFIAGRVFAAEGISNSGAYHARISPSEYTAHASAFLNELLLRSDTSWTHTWLVLAPIWFIAIGLRSKLALLGAFLFTVGILPVAFIVQRGIDAIYIPLAGLAMWAGDVIVRLADAALAWVPRRARTAVIYSLVVLLLALAYRGRSNITGWKPEYELIRETRLQLTSRHPKLIPGSGILFLKDPFPSRFEWASLMLIHLAYNDASLEVDNPARLPHAPGTSELSRYRYVWSFENGKLTEVDWKQHE